MAHRTNPHGNLVWCWPCNAYHAKGKRRDEYSPRAMVCPKKSKFNLVKKAAGSSTKKGK